MSQERAFRLKFDIGPEEHERLRAVFFADDAPSLEKSRRLSVYLDTPDAVLRDQDLLWCFSRKDKISNGRLKTGGWRLDREGGARAYVKKHRLFNRLGGVFTLRLDRELVLHQLGETVVEIALDHADLRHGDRSIATSEVKFTLQEGEADDLVRFVAEIWPQSRPAPVTVTHVERGYRLAELASSDASAEEVSMADASVLSKKMRAADAFKLIARAEIGRAAEEPLSTDGSGLTAIRRVGSAFQFFADIASNGPGGLPELQAALEKMHDLDEVLRAYLKPAARRGRWDGAASLVARIAESQTRAHAAFAQTWPHARVNAMFQTALDQLETHQCPAVAGNETLSVFMAHELTKALEAIGKHGQAVRKALKTDDNDALQSQDAHRLRQAVAYLQDAIGFFKPLTKGKSEKRRAALLDELGGLLALLEKEHHLAHAQALTAETSAHIARLKQTKTQNAQTYAAAALSGYTEALKTAEPEKAFRTALEAVAEIKPFWVKSDER